MRNTAIACLTAFVSILPPPAPADPPPDTPPGPKRWDVASPPGTPATARIDTDEGTWMSLDVSPDGREIVFDLLGDIYVLPFEGGDARPVTSGMAWDMQPRISPDGRLLAFVSDRGGGDNIWVSNRDGTDPRPVSTESFRLLSSPAWAPDGRFIAARKHFTARRSLGAGEIWLFHRAGGAGVQLTKRPNDQKDTGEPAFSPDGRYLYFSQDVTPGDIFEYNRDPNGQIYVVQRLDRETGRIDEVTGGPGSAVRPTPSPDGRSLAFARRIRGKSVLHVRDLRSGAERALYDGLDRDMMETWAIHGVYPGMAWTPDSSSVVVWAGGRIRSVRTDTGAVSTIPFRVRDTRELRKAARTRVEVAPARFPVRMLRSVEVAPDGRQVVYQALGRVWKKALPDGEPHRLTRQTDHFEHDPSFSRDGRFVVYATWDDEQLGTVRVVPAAGGAPRIVTREPGHYVEPAMSPDGRTVVFRKTTGGFIRSPRWSSEPGIYRVPADGGAATLVQRKGSEPHFAARSDRVYVVEEAGQGELALSSVGLDGSEPHVHARSRRATAMRISPDGRWLAYEEHYRAYVLPFTDTSLEVTVGPKEKAFPQALLSTDTGACLHWAGDSRRVYWARGPELLHRDLWDAFAFVEGAPAELPGPQDAGVPIGFESLAWRPAGILAVVGARLVTMRGDEVIEDGTIVVERDRVVDVGPRDSVRIPPGAFRVDGKGLTVLPGFVDAHAHIPHEADRILPEQNWKHLATLAFGVTTTHDPSNPNRSVFAAAELQRAGMIVAPRIFSTGTILYGADASITAPVESLEDAEAHVRRQKAVGAVSVKSYNQPRRDQRQQILEAARKLGLMVVPEGGSVLQHNLTQLVDGHTSIEHAIPVAEAYADVVQLWSQSEVGYNPTFVVAYGGLMGERHFLAKTPVWANERLQRFVPRPLLDEGTRRPVTAPDEEWNHIRVAVLAKRLADRGVMVGAGAHGQREGLALHWEIWSLVQGGMSPHRALRAATLEGARYLGLDGDIGSLEKGRLADLAVIEGNPLEDIRRSEDVRWVVLGGRLFDARTMGEEWPVRRERAPFFWEGRPAEGSGRSGVRTGRCSACGETGSRP